MNFGPPRMEVREPRKTAVASERVKKLFARRLVMLRGTHWLVIYPGRWRLELADGLIVRDTSSAKKLDIAVARLDGEKLKALTIDPRTGTTVFYFDLGARLIARGSHRSAPADEDELWSVHARARYVSVYARGRYAFGPTSSATTKTMPIGGSEPVVISATRRVWRELLGPLR